MNKIYVVTKLASILLLMTFATAVTKPTKESVDITFLSCDGLAATDAQAFANNMATHSNVALAPIVYKSAVRFRSLLSPGAYFIGISTRRCSDSFLLVVLRGEPRHVLSIGTRAVVHLDGQTTLSGALPWSGLTVAIVYKNLHPSVGQSKSPDGYLEIPAVVDGNAYYATQLPDGLATVRLYSVSRQAWIDMPAVRIQLGSPGAQNVVRNISALELVNHRAQSLWE